MQIKCGRRSKSHRTPNRHRKKITMIKKTFHTTAEDELLIQTRNPILVIRETSWLARPVEYRSNTVQSSCLSAMWYDQLAQKWQSICDTIFTRFSPVTWSKKFATSLSFATTFLVSKPDPRRTAKHNSTSFIYGVCLTINCSFASAFEPLLERINFQKLPQKFKA